jgi:hypothetical protein
LLRRAVLLLGPGELQELHELPTDGLCDGTCKFIQSVLAQEVARSPLNPDGGARRDAPVLTALVSLRVIQGEKVVLPVALIQQCAGTLTELECFLLSDDTTRVLPQCKRLESLTLHSLCPPAAWLGLSQLHTLRGVSLSELPAVTTVAAALPRLHTLHLKQTAARADFLVGFYEELLPRLRSFHLEGRWPTPSDEPEMAHAPPLPLLEDLKWWNWGFNNLPHQLMGARPSMLNTHRVDLVAWMMAADGVGADSATAVTSPLARVRALSLRFGGISPDAAFMARLLCAAPCLRQLTFYVRESAHARRLLSDELAFAGLAHPRLRHVAFTRADSALDVPVPSGCGVRLRQRHFPRLRRLTVDGEEYPVWVPRWAGRRKTF